MLILLAAFRQHLHVSWSGLTCPPPGDLLDPGIEAATPVSRAFGQILSLEKRNPFPPSTRDSDSPV